MIDTELFWLEAIQFALADCRCALDSKLTTSLIFGRTWDDISFDLMPFLRKNDVKICDIEAKAKMRFDLIRESKEIVIKTSVTLLRQLAESNRLAIVSGASRLTVMTYIESLGINEQVEFHLGSEDYARGKPDPCCYLLAASRMGVNPNACCVFEDSFIGVASAKAAGMFCVALKRPRVPIQDVSCADAILSDLSEFDIARLPEYLL